MERLPTVLVVDDDEKIMAAFAEFLRREDCTMLAASTAEEGVRIVRRQAVDLLITDIRLRHQSGVMMFLECLSIRADLPVIAITGYPESISEAEIRQLGARDVLTKPLDLDRLRAAVRACIRRFDSTWSVT